MYNRPDEVQIVIANSELAIETGDFDKAIAILQDVRPESPAYVRLQVYFSPGAWRCRQSNIIELCLVKYFETSVTVSHRYQFFFGGMAA